MDNPISQHLLDKIFGGDKKVRDDLAETMTGQAQCEAIFTEVLSRVLGTLQVGGRLKLPSGEEYLILHHDDTTPGYYLAVPVCDDVCETAVLEAKVIYHPKTVAAIERAAKDPGGFLARLYEHPEVQAAIQKTQEIQAAAEAKRPKFILAAKALYRAGLCSTVGEAMLQLRAGRVKINHEVATFDTPLIDGETYTIEYRGERKLYTPNLT